MKHLLAVSLTILLSCAAMALAGPADVVSVSVTAIGDNQFRFRVTVRHADEGWDHYADRWEVLTLDGILLGTRTLYHPHVDEQPFTRELSGVVIPEGISQVVVQAHDSKHGMVGGARTVDLPNR